MSMSERKAMLQHNDRVPISDRFQRQSDLEDDLEGGGED